MQKQTRTSRVVFFSGGDERYYTEEAVSFTWYMGMSWQVRQRSSISLRENLLEAFPDRRVIEASTASDDYGLGRQLSAFNLTLDNIPIENLFQGSKVFSDSTGPFTDIYYDCSPKEAKSDNRIRVKKGRGVIGFSLKIKGRSIEFDAYPHSAFYDYLYINALSQHPEVSERVVDYDAFTDINFNQKIPYSDKGPFNCQARSLAIYVELARRDELGQYLQKPEEFTNRIYGCSGRLV